MRETSNPGESSKPVMAVGGGSPLSVYTVQLVNEIRSEMNDALDIDEESENRGITDVYILKMVVA